MLLLWQEARSILIVGHGATHDLVCDALAPHEHPACRHTGAAADGSSAPAPPHCSVTTLQRSGGGGWRVVGFAVPTVEDASSAAGGASKL